MFKLVQTFLMRFLIPMRDMIPPRWRIAVAATLLAALAGCHGLLLGVELTPEQAALANEAISTIQLTIVALFGVQLITPKKTETKPTEPPKE